MILRFLALLVSLALAASQAQAQTEGLTPTPIQHFVDSNGIALVGGKLFTYAAGTTSKLNTYTDVTGGTPQTNPIILNSRGEPEDANGNSLGIWIPYSTAYKFVLSPANDTDPPSNPIWTLDNIQNIAGGSAPACSTSVAGLVPPTGGGTTNFLRADCTFAPPPGGGVGCGDPAGPSGGVAGQDCVSTGGTGAEWAQEILGAPAAVSSNLAGQPVTLLGGTGDGTGSGGGLTAYGGTGGSSGDNGISILAGGTNSNGDATVEADGEYSSTGQGGAFFILGGLSASGQAGSTSQITGGSGNATGNGGELDIQSGDADDSGNGGFLNIHGGMSANANGGLVIISGGSASSGNGNGGNTIITSGVGGTTGGLPGDVLISPANGNIAGGFAGNTIIIGGDAASGSGSDGGNITLKTGNGDGSTGFPGDIVMSQGPTYSVSYCALQSAEPPTICLLGFDAHLNGIGSQDGGQIRILGGDSSANSGSVAGSVVISPGINNASSSGTVSSGVFLGGHIGLGTSTPDTVAPAVTGSGCGIIGSDINSDTRGRVTTNGSATSCTITFQIPYNDPAGTDLPYCLASPYTSGSQATTIVTQTAISETAVTFNVTGLTGGFTYLCSANG